MSCPLINIDPSQMTRWRKRIGESGCERLLKLTIDAGKRTKTITERSVEKVIVDRGSISKSAAIGRTRERSINGGVQPKAMAHPTDARLYRKIHGAMIRIAKSEDVALRQSYTRTVRNEFSQHASEVECVGKGKPHRPYEFGVKVSLPKMRIRGCNGLPGPSDRSEAYGG